ncbi:hypothetical protein D3C87_1358450 [compost metagenome]
MLENATPASAAATATRERKTLLDGSRISKGRAASTWRAADTARLADTGLRWMFHSDSKAWDSASRPLARVVPGGRLSISEGSIKAASGQVQGRCSEYLRPCC